MASDDITTQIKELTALVNKQNEVIAKTGKQVLELQMKDVRTKMANIDMKPVKVETEDFATNEDIVQLVGELQIQLDHMEDRNIKRVFNSNLTSSSDPDALIAPLSTRDGEPAPENFPATVGELLKLQAADILQLCEYYDLLPPEEPSEELAELLKNDDLSAADAQKLFAPDRQEQSLEERVKALSSTATDNMFDDFARFIGVRIRRGQQW
ncbi:hypothetical protein EJF18_30783 [Clavispora lusitaniae]|uniref:Mrp8p n=3 Tax=Clavispora lusitaniae TaxID=36911 RepID=C4Y4C3_CLAL4|nr:uncharacterized protein CLUG_02495 [Clavispora lusitaniae ATCC 42720]KAF5211394.1 hypothetical protein E0198_002702 [Clavispora lusitaniae]EEQ38369.1 hypothetical protein CLUG_02495 [Clavispora lusitaniae ATCC 42720]KAF7580232.1 hypothetical protein FOB63_005302 [Clavispora lusitaniae]OVF04309.1 hypothetical protein A9F13_28g00066 [Clavispora lusitaniae]QFZ27796.1 hypothetical protein EJF14_30783 [Clavispora lusitaniae]